MTPEQIEELRADMAAGTPGPWELDGIAIAGSDLRAGDVCLMGHPAQYPGDTVLMLVNHEANARRIARVPTLEAEVLRLTEANAALAEELVTFCAVWAVPYAQGLGLPDGHLHPLHYDMLERYGARMDDFTRAALPHTGMTGQREGV
jgi:hypothetical protein